MHIVGLSFVMFFAPLILQKVILLFHENLEMLCLGHHYMQDVTKK
jgi:hypothetical protein